MDIGKTITRNCADFRRNRKSSKNIIQEYDRQISKSPKDPEIRLCQILWLVMIVEPRAAKEKLIELVDLLRANPELSTDMFWTSMTQLARFTGNRVDNEISSVLFKALPRKYRDRPDWKLLRKFFRVLTLAGPDNDKAVVSMPLDVLMKKPESEWWTHPHCAPLVFNGRKLVEWLPGIVTCVDEEFVRILYGLPPHHRKRYGQMAYQNRPPEEILQMTDGQKLEKEDFVEIATYRGKIHKIFVHPRTPYKPPPEWPKLSFDPDAIIR